MTEMDEREHVVYGAMKWLALAAALSASAAHAGEWPPEARVYKLYDNAGMYAGNLACDRDGCTRHDASGNIIGSGAGPINDCWQGDETCRRE